MQMTFPTFSSVFSSSSADVASFGYYVLPVIYVAFAVVAVVAVTTLMVRFIMWFFHKLSTVGHDDLDDRVHRDIARTNELLR